MTTTPTSPPPSFPPPDDWTIEEYADPELIASTVGADEVVERQKRRLYRRQAEIAAERAIRG